MTVEPKRIVRVAAWTLASLAVGILGWLLVALSEGTDDRIAGVLLLLAAAVAGACAIQILRRPGTSRLESAGSAALVLAGLAGGLLHLAGGGAFLADVLLIAALPIACGVLTWWLSRGSRPADTAATTTTETETTETTETTADGSPR
jgi:drug/metabolite transporter (DMT)-like permease